MHPVHVPDGYLNNKVTITRVQVSGNKPLERIYCKHSNCWWNMSQLLQPLKVCNKCLGNLAPPRKVLPNQIGGSDLPLIMKDVSYQHAVPPVSVLSIKSALENLQEHIKQAELVGRWTQHHNSACPHVCSEFLTKCRIEIVPVLTSPCAISLWFPTMKKKLYIATLNSCWHSSCIGLRQLSQCLSHVLRTEWWDHCISSEGRYFIKGHILLYLYFWLYCFMK